MRRFALLLLALTFSAGSAAASTRSALKMELLPVLPEPIENQVYFGTLRVTAFELIDEFSVDLIGGVSEELVTTWTQVSIGSAPTSMLAGEVHEIDFQAICVDVTEPLFVEYTVNGDHLRRDFMTVSRAARVAVEVPVGLSIPGKIDSVDAKPDPLPTSGPSPRDAYGEMSPGLDDTEVNKALFTLYARIVYQRSDGEWAGVDGVSYELWDEDSGADDLLGSGVTDNYGRIIQNVWSNELPDIYVRFKSGNSKIEVQEPSWGEPAYSFTSKTFNNQPNSGAVHLPDLTVTSWTGRRVMHQVTSLTRAWRWLDVMGYGHIDNVQMLYPDSDWPHYSSSATEDEIHLPSNRGWKDGTMWHEYGHHFINEFGDKESTEYCNAGERCDQSGTCRHCWWCEEVEGVAWSEGFANWMSDRISADVEQKYSAFNGSPLDGYNFETNQVCDEEDGGSDTYDNPAKTEGALAGLLRDLADANVDSDPRGGTSKDVTNFGSKAILDLANIEEPTTPWQFLVAFRDNYPSYGNGIWNAAYNNGYNIDVTNPLTVTSLTSTSHGTVGDSPDATIDFQWTRADDEMSGIQGYSILLQDQTGMPDVFVDIESIEPPGATEKFTTDILDPGTYYFNIRAIDNAGNASDDYVSYGPITIRDPYPADLVAVHNPSFFDAPLVATASVMPSGQAYIPPVLPPYFDTYLHVQLFNSGELATASSFTIDTLIDGEVATSIPVNLSAPIPGATYWAINNIGPFSMPMGRHTVGYVADATEKLAEANERDNEHVGQFVWDTVGFGPGVTLTRAAPPHVFAGGGIENVCDGVSIAIQEDRFGGMFILPHNEEQDYDLVLHRKSTDPEDGFELATKFSGSSRPAGSLDGVFYNGFTLRTAEISGGIERIENERTATYEPYDVTSVVSSAIGFDQVHSETWAANELLQMYHVSVPSSGVGQMEIRLQTNPADGPLNVQYLSASLNYFGLGVGIYDEVTDENGFARILVDMLDDDYGIVVWRDPKDRPDPLNPPPATSFDLRVSPARPNLRSYAAAGWTSGFVPRPTPDATPIQTVYPDYLSGNFSTWFNVGMENQRNRDAVGQVVMQELVDGVVLSSRNLVVEAMEKYNFNNLGPHVIRGGRHTLTQSIDPGNLIEEDDETDNTSGGQWDFDGLWLTPHVQVSRPAPPDPIGGWDAVDQWDLYMYFNCDGLTTRVVPQTSEDGYWQAVVATPGGASDVDLRLHPLDPSVFGWQAGFAEPLMTSAAGLGQTDFLIISHRSRTLRTYDVGAINMAGSQNYVVELVNSIWVGDYPTGTVGSYSMPSGKILQLYELRLAPGTHVLGVRDPGGTADLGVSVHRANQYYGSRDFTHPQGLAWSKAAGQDEYVTIDVATESNFCVAVWKVGRADLSIDVNYQLFVDDAVTGVEPPMAPVADTQITAVHPNPFNPRTTVAFELETDGDVALAVFDLRGRLVRELVSGSMAAGRHEAIWDGVDLDGHRVSSGTYFARLDASGVTSTQKLTLVK